MDDAQVALRRSAAAGVKAYYAGELSLGNLIAQFPICGDAEIDELMDLVEHEPKCGGFFGASEDYYAFHMGEIHRLIDALAT